MKKSRKSDRKETIVALIATAFVIGMLVEKIAICGISCLTTIYR